MKDRKLEKTERYNNKTACMFKITQKKVQFFKIIL